jgi:hypothetical protein
MTTSFKLYLCAGLLLAIGLYGLAPIHIGNPVPGLMDTLHAAERAVGR